MKHKNQLILVGIMLLQVSLSFSSSSSAQQDNFKKIVKIKKTAATKPTLSKPVSIYNHEMFLVDKTMPTLQSMLTPMVANQLITRIEQAIKKNEPLEMEDLGRKILPPDVIIAVKPALDEHCSGPIPLIVKAVIKKNQPVVACLCQLQVDLEVKDKAGYKPLMRASENGDLDMVKLLIASGANVACDSDYYAPILLATKNGHDEVVKELYRNGADVNGSAHHYHNGSYYKNGIIHSTGIKNTGKNSPVLNAFKYGHSAIGMDLIENAGANYDVTDNNADTPLIWAARNNDWASVGKIAALHLKKIDDENLKRKNTESVAIDHENNDSNSVAKRARNLDTLQES